MSDTDNGNVLRVTKSSPNVHLDWSLDGTSGPFVLKRSLSFTFSNALYLGPGQMTKTFDDGVLNNGTSYAYEAFRRSLTDTLYFYHAGHLGTPIAMTNGAGALVWRAEHTPFGGIYALTVGTITDNLRFPGQYYDGETGLAQNYFRDYNNRTGRYWEVDPLDRLTISRVLRLMYLYGDDNAIVRFDPNGLLVKLCRREIQGFGIEWGKFHHEFLWVNGSTYGFESTSGGKVAVDSPYDHMSSSTRDCKEAKCVDEGRLLKNINNEIANPDKYDFFSWNCQDWAHNMLQLSHQKGCCSQQ